MKAWLLFTIGLNAYATDMLDGNYTFRATVQEANSGDKYPFKMNMRINNNHITGEVDYFNDGCLGALKGKILSDNSLRVDETITQGKDICANGSHIYNLKHQIISKATHYMLEESKNAVTINKYSFIAKQKSWDNIILKESIVQLKKSIESLRDDINTTKQLIAKSKQNLKKSKAYLENNSTLIDGECTKPLLAKKPEPFFDTEEKANKYALAYCSISFGCRVGVELARDKLDTAAKRFLASQSCTLLVRTYQEQNTLLDETMFNLLDAVSYAGCESESDGIFSALVQGGSCVMSTATRLARVGQYMNCIDYKTKEFHDTYLDWKYEPKRQKILCDTHLKVVNDTPNIVAKYHLEIKTIEDEIMLSNREIKQLKDQLKDVLLLRQKQTDLLNSLNNF